MKKTLTIFLLFICLINHAQKDTTKYDRQEEIIDDGKRYRIHNNYLSIGFGFSYSTIRKNEQATLGIDYVFHIKRQHFQTGIIMSGDKFLDNNNLSFHLCYGYRIENEKANITFFGGLSQNKGVIPAYVSGNDTIGSVHYRNTGLYLSAAYFKKLTYDVGIGLEGICVLNSAQAFFGLKGTVFFSSAYRGKAKVYNKHVKPKRNQ